MFIRKYGKRIFILSAVFIVSFLISFFLVRGTHSQDATRAMEDASFPILSFTVDDEQVNGCHGYAQEMDVSGLRPSVTPVGRKLSVPVQVDTYGADVSKMGFKLASLDGKTLLQEEDEVPFSQSGDKLNATLKLDDTMEDGTEYMLEVILTLSSGRDIYYYSRVTPQASFPVSTVLSYAMDFHDKTFDPDKADEVSEVLETDGSMEDTDLSEVTIKSGVDEVMWGDLDPTESGDVQVDIDELADGYQSVTLKYQVAAKDSDGADRYYNVNEYFRIRVYQEDIYLLDYGRTMEQVFDPSTADTFAGSQVLLGIRDKEVNFKSSSTGTLTAFVQNGSLWLYDQGNESISLVFGFGQAGDLDPRDTYGEHDIRICSMDDSGSMQFLVYGYMDRGPHEGQVGAALYRYDSSSKVIQEEAFLSADCSYQVLKNEIGTLSYVNSQGDFCIDLDGSIYAISLEDQSVTTLEKGVDESSMAFSDDGRYLAYVKEGEADSATSLYFLDLDSEKVQAVSAPDGSYIRPLGFLGESLVYGLADKSDVTASSSGDAEGGTVFAMNTLVIVDSSLDTIKTYDEGSYYVVSASKEENALKLSRVTKEDGGYKTASDDSIVDYDSSGDADSVTVTTSVADVEQSQVYLQMAEENDDTTPKFLTTDIVDSEIMETQGLLGTDKTSYVGYVYVGGDVVYAGRSLSSLITKAGDLKGTVVLKDGTMAWNRSKDSAYVLSGVSLPSDVSTSNQMYRALDTLLEYEGVTENVEDYVGSASADASGEALSSLDTSASSAASILSAMTKKTGGEVLDLSGCTVEQLEYYIYEGYPVFAILPSGPVLVTGYTTYNLVVFDPSSDSGTTSQVSLDTEESQFQEAGSQFVVWMK